MRKRYQLSSCDSIPQPNSPAPVSVALKSLASEVVLAIGLPGPGVLPTFSEVGNQ